MSRDKTLFEKLQNSMGFFNNNKSQSTKKSPQQQFVTNLHKNTGLAFMTVPFEGLALRRIFDLLNDPKKKPISYLETIKKIGPKGLFAGSFSRANYCLVGNYATLCGIDWFGSDPMGFLKTTIMKNSVLPFFLISNARQTDRNFKQTLSFVAKGVVDPVIHASFFARNLAANWFGVLPGFMVRDYVYRQTGESNTLIPSTLGFFTSVVASTAMNAILKPFFTGIYPLPTRTAVALKGAGAVALGFREGASLALVYANTSPQKQSKEDAPEENLESTIRPK